MPRQLCRYSLFFIGMAIAGCGDAPKDVPKVAPVEGILKYKGAPVPEASVTFYPAKGPAGVGRTDAKGAFQIKTNGQLGAAIGQHKVTVSAGQQGGDPPPADGNEMALLKKSTIPGKYSDQKTTDLVIDIPNEGNKALVLDLTD